MPKRVPSGGKKLSLEGYISFLNNGRDVHSLPMDHLNQLIRMHGFSTLRTKYQYSHVLKLTPVEMMGPIRSTVEDRRRVYPCARLTLEEVRADISCIGWEECPLGSILAVGSASKSNPRVSASSANPSRPISSAMAGWNGKRKRSMGTARRAPRRING